MTHPRNLFHLLLAGFLLCSAALGVSAQQASTTQKIPVILDSDIGDDIDDTWALGLLLKSPELDVKLVVGDYGNAQYRARLLAKLLQRAGRSDIPVGVGLDIEPKSGGRQAKWVEGYDLKSYPGKVHADGVQAIIDTIMNSRQKITLICIGPLPNIAEALKREPRIAEKADFVGMHGSVRVGYGGSKPAAEWNVKCDPKACQASLSAPWNVMITPLDTCDRVRLEGNKYQAIMSSTNVIARDIIENYRFWAETSGDAGTADAFKSRSSTLFDTVAIYLAISQDLCAMEELPIRVTDDGYTVIDPKGKKMRVATKWKDLPGFEDFLVKRLADAK